MPTLLLLVNVCSALQANHAQTSPVHHQPARLEHTVLLVPHLVNNALKAITHLLIHQMLVSHALQVSLVLPHHPILYNVLKVTML